LDFLTSRYNAFQKAFKKLSCISSIGFVRVVAETFGNFGKDYLIGLIGKFGKQRSLGLWLVYFWFR
jgi:hypothetical protein